MMNYFKQGFTLVEVLVVAVIVGVLAAVGVPLYYSYVKDAQQNLMQNTLAEGANFASICLGSGGRLQYSTNPNRPLCFMRSGDTSSYSADTMFSLEWTTRRLSVALKSAPTQQIFKNYR